MASTTVREQRGESPYIYGLHDREGTHILQGKGWVVISEEIGCDPNDWSSRSYADLADQGLGVIVRLNLGYCPTGTIPPLQSYPHFAQRCGNFVEKSDGGHIWIIGNEPNLAAERPGGPNADPILPTMYAHCFRLCRREIHRRPGHKQDEVVVAAIGPWNVESEPWIEYFQSMLWELNPDSVYGAQLDGIALHVYSRGPDPSSILDDAKMDPPFDRWHSGFQAYRDFMGAIPRWARDLPVYVTECNQSGPWEDRNTGWVQAAYAEIDRWNSCSDADDPRQRKQTIRCLCLYRWEELDQWSLRTKSEVVADLRSAIAHGYRWDRSTPSPRTDDPYAFTRVEARRCRDSLETVPATAKATVERGYYWLKEVFDAGAPYAFAVAYDPRSSRYVALKLETQRWQVVAEMDL